MTSKIMNKIQKKNKNDVVYTPQKVVDIMIEDIDINDSIIDSCKGKGAGPLITFPVSSNCDS